MAQAKAKHILVQDPAFCEDVKKQIESGELTFEEAASRYSSCPSSVAGGDLGTFSPGQMVPEFDSIVFSEEVGKVHGPVSTQFGFHLILIESREN